KMTCYRGFDKFLIGSQWVEPHGSEKHTIINPANGEDIGTVRLADNVDIDRAVEAARLTVESRLWADTPFEQRSKKIRTARDYCARQSDRLVELSATELGLSVQQSKPRLAATLSYFDDAIERAKDFATPELRPDPLPRRTALVSRE